MEQPFIYAETIIITLEAENKRLEDERKKADRKKKSSKGRRR